MLGKKYILRYLPLFYEDLDEKVTYILEKLKNPKVSFYYDNAIKFF